MKNTENTETTENTENTKNKEMGIIGYIELPKGVRKPISPMNNHFLNYTFNDPKNWPALQTMANIIYSDYIDKNPKTAVTTIEGDISVKTQLVHFQLKASDTPRTQDLEIESITKIDYIEIQIETKTLLIPVEQRSMGYLGLSITRGNTDKPIQQVWLLADDLKNKSILNGKTYANFTMMDELDHRPHAHPAPFAVMYVNLKKMAKEQTKAGELANVLLGNVKEPKDKNVLKVFETLTGSFDKFKEEKEVKKMYSYFEEQLYIAKEEAKEEAKQEGREEGRQEGMQKGVQKGIKGMLKLNMSLKDIAEVFGVTEAFVEELRSQGGY